MKRENYIVSAIGIILSICVILTSLTFPESKRGVLGPGVFPMYIAGILLIASLVLFIKNIIDKTNSSSPKFIHYSKRVFIVMIILVIYLILLPFLGIIIMNTLLLSGLFIWFNKKQYPFYIGLATVISLIIYVLFNKVLSVPLDFGLLFF